MSYNLKQHKIRAQAHAKKRMHQRYRVDFDKHMRKRALWEIKKGKSIVLDSRCSFNPANSLHWIELDNQWYLLVYSISLQAIVTALPTLSKYPYSPFSLKSVQTESMWQEYERQKKQDETKPIVDEKENIKKDS